MPRRSERLVTVGYYNQSSDEESSSSISYRESPVRVFNKKRTGGRKGGSSRSSQASGTVSATNVTNERNINADDIGLAPTLRATQRRQTFLSPSSVAPSVALEPSLSFSSMSYSSGYCSEEPPRLRTRSSRSFSSGISTRTGASCTRSWLPSWLPSWFAILLFLLPFLLTFAVFLFSTAFPTMKMNLMTRPTQPDPRPDLTQKTMHGTPTMNSAFEMKMDSILREIEMMKQKEKQQRDISEMVQIMTKDLRDVRAEIDDMRVSVDSVGFESVSFDRRLDQEATEFSKQLADHQEHQFLTRGRVRALEDVSNTLQHQVTSIKNQPPPAPTPTNTHLTPEFKEAMGKWLRDRLAQDVKQVVKDYSRPLADKMPNFALESQGGSIVTSRCSETYKTGSAHVSFLGIPLWFPSESPRTVIQGQRVQPGKCWRFHGAQGTMTVALSHPVHVTHVTVEHISAAISATGHIKSAPKDFAVYGMATDREEGTRLGTFMFNQAGDPVQTFKLPNLNSVYHYVELRILSNWGHQEYTCVYRIRVHGKMPSV